VVRASRSMSSEMSTPVTSNPSLRKTRVDLPVPQPKSSALRPVTCALRISGKSRNARW
jgi:hypothetical protein